MRIHKFFHFFSIRYVLLLKENATLSSELQYLLIYDSNKNLEKFQGDVPFLNRSPCPSPIPHGLFFATSAIDSHVCLLLCRNHYNCTHLLSTVTSFPKHEFLCRYVCVRYIIFYGTHGLFDAFFVFQFLYLCICDCSINVITISGNAIAVTNRCAATLLCCLSPFWALFLLLKRDLYLYFRF